MTARSIPLKRRNFKNPQIKTYTDAIRCGQKNLHIVYRGEEGWEVKRIGDRDSHTGTFRTKDEAFNHAQRIAKNSRTEVIIHGRDGLIQDRHSYAGDPYPPRSRN